MSAPSEPHGRIRLPPLAAEAAAAVLATPRLPAATATRIALACRAGAVRVPVLLAAPAAGGRLLLARALHALSGRVGPLFGVTGRRPPLDGLPSGAGIYLDAGALAPEAVLALEALLDDGAVWVLAGLEPGGHLPSSLAGRLEAVVLDVPPLAARLPELDALATSVIATLAGRMGVAPPALARAARERLAAHAWAGDLSELEAVLGRAFVVSEGRTIEPEHLALALPPAQPIAAPVPQAPAAPELEFLLAELAHELRNPMVTVQTFARHLPDLLADAELRARFATLTTEAIGRMDGLLENMLTFARLGPPRPEAIEIGPLLARVVAEAEPELAGRTVRVVGAAGPDLRCAADPEHLAFAMRNLFAGVAREVPAHEELSLEATANGVVRLRFEAAAEAADRLRRLAAPGAMATLADPALLPLAFRLARAVLERNGGALTVVPEIGDTTSVVIRLPTAPAEEAA